MSSKVRFGDLLSLTVLAFLCEEPRHPYDMQRLIRERHKDFADGKPRSLYHAVDHLGEEGFIQPVETSREGRRPERTVYCITPEGREEFQARLAYLLETADDDHPVLAALVSFLGYLPRLRVLDVLRARAVSLQGSIAGLVAALQALQVDLKLPRLVVLEHEAVLALRRAELEWIRSLVSDIESGHLDWEPDHLSDLFQEARAVNQKRHGGVLPGRPPEDSAASAVRQH